MKILLSILSLVAVLSGSSNFAFAQFHLAIAPELGLNYNVHTGSDLSSSGQGVGFVIGGQARMMFTRTVGLAVGLDAYNGRGGSATLSLPNAFANSYYQPYKTWVLNALPPDVHDVTVSLAYFQIETLFLLKLPASGIFFEAGPAVGFSIQSSAQDNITHQEPSGSYGFNGNNQFTYQGLTTVHEKESRSVSDLGDMNTRFELKLGAGYEIRLSPQMSLLPHLMIAYGLTDVVSGVNWRVHSLQMIVPLQFRAL